jgi:hypothetical protein
MFGIIKTKCGFINLQLNIRKCWLVSTNIWLAIISNNIKGQIFEFILPMSYSIPQSIVNAK